MIQVTPIEQLLNECRAIQAFVEEKLSDDTTGEQATTWGYKVSAYLARTSAMTAEAKWHLHTKMQDEAMKVLEGLGKQVGGTAKCVNSLIDSAAKEERFLVEWCDRLNRSCTHQLDWARTLVSKATVEMMQSNRTLQA